MDSLLSAWEPPVDPRPGQRTYEEVRDALLGSAEIAARNVRVYLQGSHACNTLIRAEEAVDVVIETGTSFLAGFSNNVSDAQRAHIEGNIAAGSWDYWQFRREVEAALEAVFPGGVQSGEHLVKVTRAPRDEADSRSSAEVIVALPYRHYSGIGGWTAGMTYFTTHFEQVVHYPRLHRDNGVLKDRETEGRFTSTVRMARRMRDHLQDVLALEPGLAPSYFIECMLWNVPVSRYSTVDPALRMREVIRYLEGSYLPAFEQQHMIESLFGPLPSQWNTGDARLFIDAASRWLAATGTEG